MRTVHLVGALLLALVTVLLGPVGAGAPAAVAIDHSRGTPGPCPDDSGVTVVVDFQGLGAHGGHGGGVTVRCAPGGGMTGLEALHGAGFEVTGTSRWGQGFVCRLEGRPAADEPLPITGNEGYTEPCVDTPPAQAFWTYWHAENGGPWVFSQLGVKNRTAVAGTFEGWSFSLNATASSNPAPRFTPQREEAPAPDPGNSGDTGGSGDDDAGSAAPGRDGSEGSGDGGDRSNGSSGGDSAGGSGAEASGGGDSGGGASAGDADPGTGEDAGAGGADAGSGEAAQAAPPLPRQGVDGADDTAAPGDSGLEDAATATAADPPWSGGEDPGASADGPEDASGATDPDEGGAALPLGVIWTAVILLLLAAVAFVATRRRRASP